MKTYTVKYKTGLFWKTLKNVKGDGILEHEQIDGKGRVRTIMPVRYFVLEDETNIQVPISTEVVFSKERFSSKEEKMSQAIGQDVKLNKR